eukprot:3698813-Prymnesium_polylepis.1
MDLLQSVSVLPSSGGGVTAVIFSWSQYQPITMRTIMYTHGKAVRRKYARAEVTGRAHAGWEVGTCRKPRWLRSEEK